MGNSIALVFSHSFSSKNENKDMQCLETYFGVRIGSLNTLGDKKRKEGREEGREGNK